jgi:alpha-glucosidase
MPWRANAPHAGFSSVEPWLPVDPAHAALAVDAQERDPRSTLHAARRALALRKRHDPLRTGSIVFLDAPEPLLLFQRGEETDAMLCAFNLGDEPIAWRAPAGWRVVESVNGAEDGTLPGLSTLMALRA